MNLFELAAKITLDSSDYERDISNISKGSEGVFSSMSVAIGNLISGAVQKAVSAIEGFAKETVAAGANFEAAMSQVAAISGATGDDLDALTKKAVEMGSKTKFSATESAEAFNYMAMAGWKTQDMLDGIEGIMNLAAASGESLATTSDIVTDALTAMGYAAKDAGRLADVMAAASSNANTNVYMMGETFKYAASVAGSMGYSMEDVAEQIGLMANAGIKASQAGTALRAIITRLSTNAGESSNKDGALSTIRRLGVEFFDAEGKARDFSDVIDEVRAAWVELDDVTAAQYAKNIAGQEGISAWLALMNSAPEDVDKLRGAVLEASGTAQDMADIMVDNLSGSVTLFRSAMEGLQIQIYDKFEPTMTKLVKTATDCVAAFTGGNSLKEAFEIVKEKAGGLIGEITEGIKKTVMENGPDFLNRAKDIADFLISGFVEKYADMRVTATETLMQFLTKITEPDAISSIVDTALKIGETLLDGLIQSIPVIIEASPQIVQNILDTLIENVPKLAEFAWEAGEQIVNAFWINREQLAEAAWNIIMSIDGALKDFEDIYKSWGEQIMQKFVDGLLEKFRKVKNDVMGAFGTILDFFGIENDLAENTTYGSFGGVTNFTTKELPGKGNYSGTSLLPDRGDVQIVLEDGTLVGSLAPKIDSALGDNYTQSARGSLQAGSSYRSARSGLATR